MGISQGVYRKSPPQGPVRQAEYMGRQTAAILEAFEALPEEEKRIFTAEFLRRAVPFDSGPIDDEETAAAADQLFAVLDDESLGAEENDSGAR